MATDARDKPRRVAGLTAQGRLRSVSWRVAAIPGRPHVSRALLIFWSEHFEQLFPADRPSVARWRGGGQREGQSYFRQRFSRLWRAAVGNVISDERVRSLVKRP